MEGPETKLAICICTYRRPHLLKRLLDDIGAQTRRPELVIVVDGDPAPGQVRSVLEELDGWLAKLFYLPSNHANQPYQRYLGWRVARQENVSLLLYFDDDIHFLEQTAIEKIVLPFTWEHRQVAGVTANTITPDMEQRLSAAPALLEQKRGTPSALVRWLGDGASTRPGGLTPTGQRVEPTYTGESYLRVEWLQGRVMAFRVSALSRANFSNDLFALKYVHAGMGEDTLISHAVLSQGELLLASDVLIEHPEDDLPNSYPHQARQYGFAVAYSRRLLNDRFRWPQRPYFKDRVSLVKSYFGNMFLAWGRCLFRPSSHRFQYAIGYTRGALLGLLRPPRAKYLAPSIHWDASAEEALAMLVEILPKEEVPC